jgi:heat-inducible transcriptional repressor
VKILQAVVNDYVLTSRPVGSERLIEAYQLGCKSATVRNEMAEMSEMGYLVQPHTSAGRIPTDRGYRYYVDELMNPPAALSAEEAQSVRELQRQKPNDVSEIVLETCRLLTRLTSYPSLATDPATEVTTVRRVYLTGASPRHLLLVLLLSTGHVEHRLLEVPNAPDERALTRLSGYLNTQLASHTLEELETLTGFPELPTELTAWQQLLAQVGVTLAQMARALSERRIYLEGASQLIRQPEFQDVLRLETLLNALEQRQALYRVLSQALRAYDVTIIIGGENEFTPMQECSVVTTTYHIGERPAGCLGVVGPTRMNYDRSVAAVGLMAQHLSRMLTTLYLA